MNLTQNNTEHFNIIGFSADEKTYYPSTIMQKQSWMDDAYVSHHEMQFFEGVLIKEMFSDQETFAERINLDEDEDEQWDYFAGSERSKIFVIFTHCQKQKEDIEAITHSEQIVLLQVGENGFNDEGVFSVLISKSDLLNQNFNHCTFYWGQS